MQTKTEESKKKLKIHILSCMMKVSLQMGVVNYSINSINIQLTLY